VRILSIDGGGIRGVIPATLLDHIEHKTGRPICELFDLIAGTSTGGIIALGLTMPSDAGTPRWSAADLLGLYESEGGTIFSRSLWHKIGSIGSLVDERYPKEGIEGVLARYFGDTRLDQVLTDVIVTSYDLEAREPWFFKSTDAKLPEKKRNYLMREAARATSAAPTYFEPFHLESLDDEVDYRTLVDGGVFANNPAMCAWAEASGGGQPAEARLLSLGTGELCRTMPFAQVHDWGLVEWARPILNVVMDGVSDATNYQLREMLGLDCYLRLTHTLEIGNDDMDDAGTTNIHALKEVARRTLDEHGAELDAFLEKL
jgi:patatin-like phospholipase/acyl hydrolase